MPRPSSNALHRPVGTSPIRRLVHGHATHQPHKIGTGNLAHTTHTMKFANNTVAGTSIPRYASTRYDDKTFYQKRPAGKIVACRKL